MLNLNADPKVWITHEETGTRYYIKPITPRDNQQLVKKARDKNGDFDAIKYNGLVVEFAVAEWDGVGDNGAPIDPTDSPPRVKGKEEVLGTKRQLGEKFSGIAATILQKATSATLFVDEVEEAKND